MTEDILLANDEALTADEVASLLQVSKNTVYNLVKRDELASYHVGRKMRFTRADVQNYIARSRMRKADEVRLSAQAAEAAGLGAMGAGPGAADASAAGAGAAGAGAASSFGMANRTDFGEGAADGTSAAAPRVGGVGGATRSQVGEAPSAAASARSATLGAHAAAVPGYTIAGNDILGDMLANYLGAVDVPIKRLYEGSYRALTEAYFGNVQAALVHIFDGPTGQYNVPAVRQLVPGCPLQVIRLARRRQGFIVKRGNPKNLRAWKDLLKPGIRLANRERGCGSRILLDQKLQRLGARHASLDGYTREFPSALTMASMVARGGADVGIGAERVFHQVEGVDFLPLQDEWLDIVLMGDPGENRVAQAIIRLTRTRSFRSETAALSGYDTSHMGEVVYEQ